MLILIGNLSCEKKEQIDINKLIDGVWQLSTTNETVDFKHDMTYKRDEIATSPTVSNGFPTPPTTCSLTGEWELEDKKITFVTANLELRSNYDSLIINSDFIGLFNPDTTNNSSASTGLPYSVTWGSNPNFDVLSSSDRPNISGEAYTYTPTIWHIEELSNEILVVKSQTETLVFYKK